MKRTIFAAIVAALFASCTQGEREYQTPAVVNARFGWHIVSGNDMTRAVTADGSLSQIRALLPTDADINKNGIKISNTETETETTIKLGKTYTLTEGTFTCKYEYRCSCLKYADYSLCTLPTFKIDYTFGVTRSESNYLLPAQYTCAAFAWNINDCTFSIDGNPLNTTAQHASDGTAVIFILDYTADTNIRLKIEPTDTEHCRTTEFDVSGEDIQRGHFYRIEPASSVSTALFTLGLDDFTEGTL